MHSLFFPSTACLQREMESTLTPDDFKSMKEASYKFVGKNRGDDIKVGAGGNKDTFRDVGKFGCKKSHQDQSWVPRRAKQICTT